MFSPCSILLSSLLLGSVARAAEVSARLEIPPAATHVIGDPIPLVWHFTNSTDKALAFVWEACCRLNGRMDVRRNDVDLPTIPPGPSSAHQFAKPAILPPKGEQRFESLLADWAFLTNSGRYEITGHYVGVVDSQRPPVPPSIALWRGQATTPPASVELLTVADYFAQRPDRVNRSGLDATVLGPEKLPAVGAAQFRVRIRNTSDHPLTLRWPLDVDLWLVDHGGIRIFRSPTKPDVSAKELALPAGGLVEETFPLSVDDLNRSPLGDYGVFLDFREGEKRPRVPSTRHTVRWNPEAEELLGLLRDASEGGALGSRNAPLRRLREYLGGLAPALESLPLAGLTTKAAQLREDLLLANCLSALPTRTGRATLAAEALPGGSWRFTEPAVLRCLADAPPAQQLERVLAVRRHLGLEVAVNLRPTRDTKAAEWIAVARQIAASTSDLATAPRYLADAPTNQIPGSISFLATAPNPQAKFIVESDATGRPTALLAAHLNPPQRASTPTEIAALASALPAGVSPSVHCPPAMTWSELQPWLEPFLSRGVALELLLASDGSRSSER